MKNHTKRNHMANVPKQTVLMTKISKVVKELFLLNKTFKRTWKQATQITESDVHTFEAQLGNPLPIGFRDYVLKYGLGGPLLREDIDHGVPTSLELSDCDLAKAKEIFSYERTFVENPSGKKKQSIKKIKRGVSEENGTFYLGCPTGTHTSFYLVLNGEYAGEVWKGDFSLSPSKHPQFLDLTLAFLTKKLRAARKKKKLGMLFLKV